VLRMVIILANVHYYDFIWNLGYNFVILEI
jgi:hypothetical protein